jgi:transposase
MSQYREVCNRFFGLRAQRRLAMTQDSTLTVGVDLGDKYSHLCVLDGVGDVVEEGRVRTMEAGLRKRFAGMPAARIAIETGTHSPWVSRLLTDCGHEVVVAQSRKLRMIFRNPSKNDRADAQMLARVARLDPQLLAPIRHRSSAAQADLAVLRSRQALVRARTDLVNHVRGAVKSFGARLPKCSTGSFARRGREAIPEALGPALLPVLVTIEQLTADLRAFDRRVEKRCEERYPATAVLRQVAGVGPLTALAYVLVLEDPGRFAKSRAVGSHLGLRPQQSDSGEHEPQLRITKAGDKMLRTLLVQAAQYILGPFAPDTDLRRWGMALAGRGGKNAKKRAVVAVARKLAVLLHRLWVTGEIYEPLRQAKQRKTA